MKGSRSRGRAVRGWIGSRDTYDSGTQGTSGFGAAVGVQPVIEFLLRKRTKAHHPASI